VADELDNDDPASTEQLNYFNYFTEVEDEFVRRRGKHLLVSPMDWALVESWKDAGIPLTVVIRGISRAFDAFEARPKQFRRINSILYCEQAVEEIYAEYQLARVGGPSSDRPDEVEGGARPAKRARAQTSSFTGEALLDFIERCQRQLADTSRGLSASDSPPASLEPVASSGVAGQAIDRAQKRLAEICHSIRSAATVDAEAVEIDLCALDNMLFEQLKLAYGPETMESLRAEAETQLKTYKANMDKELYDRTLDNFVGKRLRSMCGIPRLSLFYM
jgi:hypothetical protein